jgi:hypothetical protein
MRAPNDRRFSSVRVRGKAQSSKKFFDHGRPVTESNDAYLFRAFGTTSRV